jgi:predicted ATPase
MLHGEVGTGKSMLIDLFADCLPNRKKRRWHFNTFMLDTISRLEHLRQSRLGTANAGMGLQDEYSLLWLARDLIEKSPILFLDEFQLPDRVASKILSNLMTSFFQLGGVLIATSNRMPEELAKAAGMDFARPVSRLSRLGWRLGMGGFAGRDDGPGQKGEFAMFLDVLRARCEVWEMEGKSDYRRLSGEQDRKIQKVAKAAETVSLGGGNSSKDGSQSPMEAKSESESDAEETTLPRNYLIEPTSTADPSLLTTHTSTVTTALNAAISHPGPDPIPWQPSTLTVYGRTIPIPGTHSGTALFTFAQLCGATLGPADYITLASTYHTIILTQIPILTILQKNEARRLITLLDALYEARCRLLVTAAAGPDSIFFPEPPSSSSPSAGSNRRPGDKDVKDTEEDALLNDAVYPETYSEIHQDLTSPFRPNISSYTPNPSTLPFSSATLADDALEDDPPNRVRRAGSSYTDERKGSAFAAPDFANLGGLTGEDERFAVKRAQSRLWEMCSAKWWGRMSDEEAEEGVNGKAVRGLQPSWWRPLPVESRHWERRLSSSSSDPNPTPALEPNRVPGQLDPEADPSAAETEIRLVETKGTDESELHKDLFPHGASPFRTSNDAPPNISWTHVWGTMKWGKRAGAWGKGVEGLEERRREKDSEHSTTDIRHKGKD